MKCNVQWTRKAEISVDTVDTEGTLDSEGSGDKKGLEDRKGSAETVFTGHKRCSEQSGHRKVRIHRRLRCSLNTQSRLS